MQRIYTLILFILFFIQLFLLNLGYWLSYFFSRKKCSQTIVIGPRETASLLFNIGAALKPSITVNLVPYSFSQDREYSYNLHKIKPIGLRLLVSPLLLGFLSRRYEKFMYIGGLGYLLHQIDGRESEFKFLNSKGKQIVCYFVGSEIRSFNLLNRFGQKNDIDVITTYQQYTEKSIATSSSEKLRKNLALAADKYASHIFNPNIDQMSYIQKPTFPCVYFQDINNYTHGQKWADINLITIVHAPSSPIIKGTPLVRAAIKKLKEDGYQFDYREITNMPHAHVLKELKGAHIALNEFYAFVPGVFGIEAMAANAVLMTSADQEIEPSLFEGANKAWVVTPYWLIYEKLKSLLDKPELLQNQADKGTQWVKKYCSFEFSAAYMKNIIDD